MIPPSSFSPRGVMVDVSPNQRPGFDRIQLDPQDKFFTNLAQAASAGAREQEDTIFRKVSDRQYLERVSVAGRYLKDRDPAAARSRRFCKGRREGHRVAKAD